MTSPLNTNSLYKASLQRLLTELEFLHTNNLVTDEAHTAIQQSLASAGEKLQIAPPKITTRLKHSRTGPPSPTVQPAKHARTISPPTRNTRPQWNNATELEFHHTNNLVTDDAHGSIQTSLVRTREKRHIAKFVVTCVFAHTKKGEVELQVDNGAVVEVLDDATSTGGCWVAPARQNPEDLEKPPLHPAESAAEPGKVKTKRKKPVF
ncbi:hypothetical protein FN846DRAFT_902070 [Sphaerosporella brunnea]|uniref:Uncharacterized protein n=1 Tax=Sphaerosporella brunnea TaxID=1250544 RepID=A0A5J5FB01_9PEZI|nr:hypothetical protein FN846DRAFT_902070 [Sphaerosporella brunnea]